MLFLKLASDWKLDFCHHNLKRKYFRDTNFLANNVFLLLSSRIMARRDHEDIHAVYQYVKTVIPLLPDTLPSQQRLVLGWGCLCSWYGNSDGFIVYPFLSLQRWIAAIPALFPLSCLEFRLQLAGPFFSTSARTFSSQKLPGCSKVLLFCLLTKTEVQFPHGRSTFFALVTVHQIVNE